MIVFKIYNTFKYNFLSNVSPILFIADYLYNNANNNYFKDYSVNKLVFRP